MGVILPLISQYVDRTNPKCDSLIMNDLSYRFGSWLSSFARRSSVSMSNALIPHGHYHSMCISADQYIFSIFILEKDKSNGLVSRKQIKELW